MYLHFFFNKFCRFNFSKNCNWIRNCILVAQLLDVQIFDQLRKKKWFVAPLTSSFIGSTVDTFLFFSISFYATGIPWVTLSLGDLAVKIFVALLMLIPFRLLLGTLKAVKV